MGERYTSQTGEISGDALVYVENQTREERQRDHIVGWTLRERSDKLIRMEDDFYKNMKSTSALEAATAALQNFQKTKKTDMTARMSKNETNVIPFLKQVKRKSMSEAIAIKEKTSVEQHQSRWTREQIDLLKNTVCQDATDDEFKIFCYAVQRTGLDPFMKQIHMVKRWNKKTNRNDLAMQVGIDGFRLMAERTGLYAGNDEPIFDNEDEPNKATVTVYKMVQNQKCAFTASARWNEYYPGEKQGFMWDKMPCVMLGKVAEALALRKAFPADLSGLYTNDEMDQADSGPKETPKKKIQSSWHPSKEDIAALYAIAKKNEMSKEVLKEALKVTYGYDSVLKLTAEQYREFSKLVDKKSEEPPVIVVQKAHNPVPEDYDPDFDLEDDENEMRQGT